MANIATITYNNATIGTFTDNGTKALSCGNKYMSTDITINAIDMSGKSLTVTYGGNTILTIETNGTKTIPCGNKIASTDIEMVLASTIVQLNAPSIELGTT